MTAMVTGVKTNDGELSVPHLVNRAEKSATVINANKLTSILEMAEDEGLSSGIVTTTRITHATPAATYAHTAERDWESVAIRDRHGNRMTFARDQFNTGNLLKITSPNGRWIEFSYDTSDHMTKAKDNLGRTITYAYDAPGRLISATDPNGGIERYTYDESHRMLTVKKPSGDIMVTNVYDTDGRVIQQTLADD